MASDESLQKAIDEYVDTIYDRAAAEFNAVIDSAIEHLKSKRLPRSRTAINRVTSETLIERHKEGHYDHLKKKQDPIVQSVPDPETDKVEMPMPKSTTLLRKPKMIKSKPLTIKDYKRMVSRDKTYEDIPIVTADHDRPPDPNFNDLYDCQVCREVGHLCRFHQQMADKGIKPKVKVKFANPFLD